MELLIRKSTQTVQVADILEKKIVSGAIFPGTKLKSTRDLADSFSVSQQVVKSALNILEEKNLITRKSRQGIYVNSKVFSPKKKEIVYLTLDVPNFTTIYADKFFSPYLCGSNNMNFTTKSIALDNFNSLSFSYELKKLSESCIDCLIIHIPSLTSAQVSECLQLPFPVVFIGDFASGDYPDLSYNQIVEDTAERAEAAVGTAIQAGAEKIVVVGGGLSVHYSRIYYTRAKALTSAAGCELYYAEYHNRKTSISRVMEYRHECINGIIKKVGKPDAMIFDGFKKIEWFTEALQNQGISLNDLMLIIDEEVLPDTIFIQADYSEFSRAAAERINQIMENPEDRKKVVLSGLIKRTPIRISDF
ncbi:MAG: GntR family transcriptional regulator [Victivallales bacterium]|nr:GntR family transcriptional regulator [Victivallales bacterium]